MAELGFLRGTTMNNYSISMKVNNIQRIIAPYVNFADMFESFLNTIEQANINKDPIDDVCMTFKDRIIATDIQAIIRIGTVILWSLLLIVVNAS